MRPSATAASRLGETARRSSSEKHQPPEAEDPQPLPVHGLQFQPDAEPALVPNRTRRPCGAIADRAAGVKLPPSPSMTTVGAKLGHRVGEAGGICDDDRPGALRADRVGLVAAPRLTPHRRAHVHRERHGGQPHSPAGAQDEDPVPRLDLRRGAACPRRSAPATPSAAASRSPTPSGSGTAAAAGTFAAPARHRRGCCRARPRSPARAGRRVAAGLAAHVLGSGPSAATRPAATYESTGLTPAKASSTRTSPGSGAGRETSSTASGSPWRCSRAA